MTSVSPVSNNELLRITGTIGQGVQASTIAFNFLRALDKDTRAVLVLLLSIGGLIWALNHFSTKR